MKSSLMSFKYTFINTQDMIVLKILAKLFLLAYNLFSQRVLHRDSPVQVSIALLHP